MDKGIRDVGNYTWDYSQRDWVRASGTFEHAGHLKVGTGRVLNVSAGTPVQFPSNTCKFVLITAETNNTGAIWIGDSNVLGTLNSEQGFILYQGQTSNPLHPSNTNELYIDALVSTDGCTFYYEN